MNDQQAALRKVHEVATQAQVTVRTLHHYDHVGLLVPSERAANGHRLYSQGDVERLFEILLLRELGFSLDAIAGLLDGPRPSRRIALIGQRDVLHQRQRRTDRLIRVLDGMIQQLEGSGTMREEDLQEGFEAFANAPDDIKDQVAEHAEEVHSRWGDSSAYKTSMKRARSYSKEDWVRIKAEGSAHEAHMAELLRGGQSPEGEAATAGAEAMRNHIDRWFYPCTTEFHVGLAEMYVADERFREHYDQREPGLADFIAAAIKQNHLVQGS